MIIMEIFIKPFNYIFYRNYKYCSKKKDTTPFLSSAGIVAFDICWITSGIWGCLVQLITAHDLILIHFYGSRQMHLSTFIVILFVCPPVFLYYKKRKSTILNAFSDSKLNTVPFWLFTIFHATTVFVLGLLGIIYLSKWVHAYNLEGVIERYLFQ